MTTNEGLNFRNHLSDQKQFILTTERGSFETHLIRHVTDLSFLLKQGEFSKIKVFP